MSQDNNEAGDAESQRSVEITTETQFQPKKKNQILATIASSLIMLCSGCAIGYSSPALPSLEETEDLGYLTDDQRSWIASLVALGAAFGGPISGMFADRIGRKKSLMAFCLPFFIGWLLIFFAKDVWMVYIGRFISGIGSGSATLLLPIYISEMAHRDIRGSLGSAFNTFNILGIVFMFGLGIFAEWNWLAFYGAFVPLITFIALIFIPESPRYLLDKGHTKEAIEVLIKLRGATEFSQVKEEYDEMIFYIEDKERQNFKYGDLIHKPEIRKPVVLSILINIFQQLCGVTAILFYAVDIFLDSGSSVNANLATVIVASAVVASFIFMDRAGRRVLLLISEVGMAIGLGATGVFFYIKEQNGGEVPNGLDWFPVASIVIFFVSYALGIGPIPSIIYSEIIPHHVKGVGTGIVIVCNWLTIFAVTKTFDSLTVVVNEYGFFWFYAAMCLPASIFIYFWIPETKGRSLESIQRKYFHKKD